MDFELTILVQCCVFLPYPPRLHDTCKPYKILMNNIKTKLLHLTQSKHNIGTIIDAKFMLKQNLQLDI